MLADQNYHTGYTEFQEPSRIIWTGMLSIKGDKACVAMNFVMGNMEIAQRCLGQITLECSSTQQPLRILSRMRLEQSQLEGVQSKLEVNMLFTTKLALKIDNKENKIAYMFFYF